ncbi:MAG: YcbK family protein [Polyangiaceae bacterium]
MAWHLGAMAGALGVFVASAISADPMVSARSADPLSTRASAAWPKNGENAADPAPLLATLAFVHTGERVMLDADNPTNERFSLLLSDRVTGEEKSLDPRLVDLLRKLVVKYPAACIEIVSGYRSEKLNEMLRKKGHHVATHSQHSLGNAVDFRIVPAEMAEAPHTEGDLPIGIDPREMEREVRVLGWTGGVGVYVSPRDWFVHCDVGPNRRWWGK